MSEKPNKRTYRFGSKTFFISLAALVLAAVLFVNLLPENVEDFGLLSVVPALFLIGYIYYTRRILEALTLASLLCFAMADKIGFLNGLSSALLEVMVNEDMAWLIIVCGLMGSIIVLIEKSGASAAFGNWVSRRAKSRKGTLIWTWLLGVFVFIDDYLSALTVAACMRESTDDKKVSREMLSYIVDSTAAPVCMIIPISTWGVFVAKLLEINQVAPDQEGMAFFIKTIPFNFYSWFALLLPLLVILGIFPQFRALKRAEHRTLQGGPVAPPQSEKIDILADSKPSSGAKPRIANFIIPIVLLITVTVITDLDMQLGVLVTLGGMFVLYIGQKIMTAEEFADYVVEGLKSMVMPLLLMVLAFLFSYGADKINFTKNIIEAVTPLMSPFWLPAIVFLVLCATEFIMGTNWGMYIIALPIVVPLAQAVGANLVLSVSAVLAAGVFGSHICFYSDATILSSAASGCENFEHANSQLPYGPVAVALSAVAFIVAALVL
ncbi:MAG: Na+/H+ antiporter NhaC family protein [Sphaerochaetaceae bacterium]|jgi:Na+/H+ antiporter NhaC|nr:Na+/H+ antiporter NhaC family protein [Sphaerochaetaceae bacterium]NLV84295.1 sodium:proton antiporter [Spirochaetales bacterium]